MGKVNWSLANQGNISGGSFDKARPILVSSNASLNATPGMISPNAGDVRNTPRVVPDIVVDKTFENAAKATNLLVNAAFEHQEKKDQLEADSSLLEYKQQLREAYLGTPDDNGENQGGYSTLERRSAMDGFGGYKNTVEVLTKSVLESKSESVRAKMLLRVQQERTAAINRGAEHNYSQTKAEEVNLKFKQRQDILKDVELNGVAAFTNGTVASHLNTFKNLGERQAEEEYIAKESMYGAFNTAIENASTNVHDLTPAKTAYDSTAAAFEKIRPTLSEEAENAISNWLQGKKSQADSQVKAAYKERKQTQEAWIERNSPENFANAIKGGNKNLLDMAVSGYRNMHEGNSDKVVGTLKKSIALAVSQSKGAVNFSDRRAIASQYFDELRPHLTPVEDFELSRYVNLTLPKQIHEEYDYANSERLAHRDAAMAEAKANGKPMPIDEDPPPDFLPENKAKWYRMNDTYSKVSKGDLSGYSQDKASQYLVMMEGRLDDGPLTNTELDKIQELMLDGLIPQGTYSDIKKRSASKGTSTNDPWKNTASFVATKGLVSSDNTKAMFAGGLPPVKPTKKGGSKEKEYVEAKEKWDFAADLGVQRAKLELNKAAAAAHAAGVEFDGAAWWKDYVRKGINGGSILSPETQSPGFLQRMKSSVMDAAEAGKQVDMSSKVMYELTGNPKYLPKSIMEQ